MRKLVFLFMLCAIATHAQINNGGGSATGPISGLTAATNSNVGTFNWSQAGVFTNAGINETTRFILLGGGGSCDIAHIINGSGTTTITDAVSGCANTPTSGVTNGFTNGVGGYVQVNDNSSGGQFGKVIGVGVFGSTLCAVANTKCEGVSTQVLANTGLSGIVLQGSEIGVTPANTTDTGMGILLSFEGGGFQPTSDNFPGVVIQTPTGSATFTTGFECRAHGTSTNACVGINPTAASGEANSQNISFTSNNGAATQTALIDFAGGNYFEIGGNVISAGIFNTAGAGFGQYLKSTASLSVNQLVKIDTANADSVVVCTTADTSCDGFVVDNANGTADLCGAASTFCAIVTVSGSRVKGILGTGTCSIGNYVIVDTTTNGRIKCQAGVPAIGNVIGKALSAQVTVGNTVDILTKFE